MAVIEHAPLGRLRSSMHLTLHTHHAIRLWQGRMPAAELHGIFGLVGFVTVLNRIHRDAAQDDPYADAWLLRVEAKLDNTRTALLDLRNQLDNTLSHAPAAISLGDNLNQAPLHLPVTVNAPMAFLALYLLADYDELVRRALLAQHVALIDPPLLDSWLEEGAHQLRSLFSLVQPYRSSGVCRNDLLGPTLNALRAREAFGELPQAVVNRQRRARHAPVIRSTGPKIHRAPEQMPAEAIQR